MIRLAAAALAVFLCLPAAARADIREFEPLSFRLAMQRSKLVVLDFHTRFCKLCRSRSPILETVLVKEDARGEVEAFLVDFEKSPDLRTRYDVQYSTTILFFHKGQEVKRVAGEIRHEAIEQAIRKAFLEARRPARPVLKDDGP